MKGKKVEKEGKRMENDIYRRGKGKEKGGN